MTNDDHWKFVAVGIRPEDGLEIDINSRTKYWIVYDYWYRIEAQFDLRVRDETDQQFHELIQMFQTNVLEFVFSGGVYATFEFFLTEEEKRNTQARYPEARTVAALVDGDVAFSIDFSDLCDFFFLTAG